MARPQERKIVMDNTASLSALQDYLMVPLINSMVFLTTGLLGASTCFQKIQGIV
jgi:hypothetical protein